MSADLDRLANHVQRELRDFWGHEFPDVSVEMSWELFNGRPDIRMTIKSGELAHTAYVHPSWDAARTASGWISGQWSKHIKRPDK